MTILITGATGTVSGEVLRALAGTTGVRALVRDAGRTPPVAGVEYAVGDLADPSSLPAVFDGVTTLWLLTPMGPHAPHLSMNALWAARRAGARHVVRLSAVGAAHDAPTRNGRLHALSNAELTHSGLAWTILRPHFFMQNLLGALVGNQLFGIAGEGSLGLVDVRDVAAVAAEVLTRPARHEARIYTPTGPESMSLRRAAGEFAAHLGRPVGYTPLTPDQAHSALLQAGVDPWAAAVSAEYAEAYAGGWGDFTTTDVRDVIGRPPRTVGEFVHDHRDRLATAAR